MERFKSNSDQAGEVYEILYELCLHRTYRNEHITDNELKYLGSIWKNLKYLRSFELDLQRYETIHLKSDHACSCKKIKIGRAHV